MGPSPGPTPAQQQQHWRQQPWRQQQWQQHEWERQKKEMFAQNGPPKMAMMGAQVKNIFSHWKFLLNVGNFCFRCEFLFN